MTDTVHLPDTPETGAVATLTGVLAGESDRAIRVRVADGIWTFRRRDVCAVNGPGDRAAAIGETVRVAVRRGTTADFTRRLRIDIAERPLTLAAPPSETVGDAQLYRLTESWAARLDLADAPGRPATFTCAQTRSRRGSDDNMHCDSLD